MKNYYLEKIKPKISINNIQFFLLNLFIIILPYHYMVICVFGKNIPFIRGWKEVLIFGMLILDIIMHIKKKERYKLSKIDMISILFLFVLVIYILLSDNKYSALYMARVYFLPLLLVPIVSHIKIDKSQFKIMLHAIAINSIVLCVWGIIQSIFLGDKFLINIGYDHYFNVNLGYERLQPAFYISGIIRFQRLVSTFVAPNTCGMYLAIIFTLLLYFHKKAEMNKKLFYSSIGILSIAILLTFSRSTWLALALSVIIYIIKNIKFTKKTIKHIIIGFFVIILLILLIDALILKGTIFNIGTHLIYNTLSFKDSSMIGHIDSLKESVETFTKNVFGLGLGENGPRAMGLSENGKANLTESSYFLILYDVGIIGFIVYFSTYIVSIIENRKIRKKYNITEIGVVSVIIGMFLIAYVFLPYVQEFELLAMLYLIIGIQFNYKNMNKLEEET